MKPSNHTTVYVHISPFHYKLIQLAKTKLKKPMNTDEILITFIQENLEEHLCRDYGITPSECEELTRKGIDII